MTGCVNFAPIRPCLISIFAEVQHTRLKMFMKTRYGGMGNVVPPYNLKLGN